MLNRRFTQGHPTNDLGQAGVLVHQIDALDLSQENSPEWLPCEPNQWCAAYRDRFSASLISKRLPYLFSPDEPGFVIRPTVAASAYLCAYPRDAGTMGKKCDPPGVSASCVPGCRVPGGAWSDYMRHDKAHLKQMLEWNEGDMYAGNRIGDQGCRQPNCFYNEVVLSAAVWVHRLPGTIEAVFYPKHNAKAEKQARDVLRRFLEKYPSSYVPLVSLDMRRLAAPFQ